MASFKYSNSYLLISVVFFFVITGRCADSFLLLDANHHRRRRRRRRRCHRSWNREVSFHCPHSAVGINARPVPAGRVIDVRSPLLPLSAGREDEPHEDPELVEEKESAVGPEMQLFPEPGTLLVDLVALTVACELLGLTDALGDSEFWRNGGWFQPIPAAPSSLPTLVQRFSVNAVAWIAGSAASANLFPIGEDRESDASSNQQQRSAIGSSLTDAAVFTVIRVFLGAAVAAFASTARGSLYGGDHYFLEILRECYVVGLSVTAARYMYSRLDDYYK